MGDEQHGQPVLLPDAGQQLLHVMAGQRIERAERLVHQQHLRPVGERAGDGDALLHAAREFARIGLRRSRRGRPAADARAAMSRGLRRDCPAALSANSTLRLRGQPGQQRVALEDDAAVEAGRRRSAAPSIAIAPSSWSSRPATIESKRRLAAARRADQRHELVVADVEIDALRAPRSRRDRCRRSCRDRRWPASARPSARPRDSGTGAGPISFIAWSVARPSMPSSRM